MLVNPGFPARLGGSISGANAAWFTLPVTNMAAHYDASVGTTVATGVSNWADQSGNGRDLIQATAASQPALGTDALGRPIITFDGVNDYLKSAAFTLNQPETIYFVGHQASWTLSDYIYDGNATNTGVLQQGGATPRLRVYAGKIDTTLYTTANANLAVGANGVDVVVFNGASSSHQINKTAAQTGNAGAANMRGFTLGSKGVAGNYSNIIVYEVIIYSAAHTAAERDHVISGLMAKYGII